jgi:tRNA G18 (ribose-2'-O)-methylase SpoU
VAIEFITDPDDERVAEYRNVPDAALLRDGGLFVAEGRLVVRRLLAGSRFATRSVLVTDAAYVALEELLADARVPVYRVPQPLLHGITGFNIHRGCLAIGERGPAAPWQTVAVQRHRLVLIEGVADADNIGSIFRNAAAFGVEGVLLEATSTDPLYRKAIRTSMGAALTVPFARVEPWREGLDCLRQQRITLIGLTPAASTDIRDIASRTRGHRVALMVGHEGHGLSASALDACDHLARIPMRGAIDSLNVATAAAIALYELQA